MRVRHRIDRLRVRVAGRGPASTDAHLYQHLTLAELDEAAALLMPLEPLRGTGELGTLNAAQRRDLARIEALAAMARTRAAACTLSPEECRRASRNRSWDERHGRVTGSAVGA